MAVEKNTDEQGSLFRDEGREVGVALSRDRDRDRELAASPLARRQQLHCHSAWPPVAHLDASVEPSSLERLTTIVDGGDEHSDDGEGVKCWEKSISKPHSARWSEVRDKPPPWSSFVHYHLWGQKQRPTYN